VKRRCQRRQRRLFVSHPQNISPADDYPLLPQYHRWKPCSQAHGLVGPSSAMVPEFNTLCRREGMVVTQPEPPVNLGEIFVQRLPTRTKWQSDPSNARLHVYGSDFVSDLKTIRNRIIKGEITFDISAIVYRGVFAIRGRYLSDWLSGVMPNDPNDC
jgi:hypothetical protein